MQFLFDSFDKFETPNISLANPDLSLLYSLGTIHERNLNLRYNGLSKFSFVADKYQNGILNDYYDYLDYRRIVVIDGIGNFMIVSKDEDGDGINKKKIIGCESLETELNFKKLSVFKGVFKFWDEFDVAPTLLGTMLRYLPGWYVGYVSPSLYSIYRTFDISDTTIYSFLMNEVSQTYQCIFTFDSINRTINAYDTNEATSTSDIYLSYNNLVERVKISEITEELVTALNVYGGGELDIHTVNPLGTNTIYDFSYYKNTDWMSGGLISSLTIWENKIAINQPIYADLLSVLKTQNASLLDIDAEIETLKSAPMTGEEPDENTGLNVLRELQTVKIRQGLPIDEINELIVQKEFEITEALGRKYTLQDEISFTNSNLRQINEDLSWETNFTDIEIEELSRFIIGSTYTNPNIIKTDISTITEIQEYSQELYDQAVQILAKVSEPRYMFEVDSVNFLFLQEFQEFITQLELGTVVTVEFEDGRYAYPVLLGFDLNYDDPDKFKMLFSNRLRLDDSAFQFSDLFNESVNSGITTSFNSEMWSSWNTYSKDTVSTFITSALDASKNAVINATNQEIMIDSTGLRGRYLDPNTGAYDPRQTWMINNMLVFTDDNWNSARLAIGQITNPTGGSSFGIVGDTIIGRLVASNELWIENENNSFVVNGEGASLINASFTISNDVSQIILDPEEGISISRRNEFEGFDKNFYIDTFGNIVFTGSLMGASGTFSGRITASSGQIGAWTIDDFGLKDDNGNYIYGNGNVKLGRLTIEGDNADFDGTFHARNLAENDYFEGNQLQNIFAENIMAGTITGVTIFGGQISWPGVRMWSFAPGFSTIETSNSLNMVSGNSQIFVQPDKMGLTSPNIQIGQVEIGDITILGNIRTVDSDYNTGTGVSGTFII